MMGWDHRTGSGRSGDRHGGAGGGSEMMKRNLSVGGSGESYQGRGVKEGDYSI